MLRRPWVEITVKVGCQNMCSYCPQNVVLGKYTAERTMRPETFSRILENVDRKTTQIHFAGFTESFLVAGAEDMMIEAYEKGFEVVLFSTLAGFTKSKCDKLKQSGIRFAEVHFHEYDAESFDREDFLDKVDLFTKNLNFESSSLSKVTSPVSRGGSLFNSGYRKGKLTCPRFNCNVVLPNGDLYLCCSDWGLKHQLGNLLTSHFDSEEISRARAEIRLSALSADSDLLCRSCEWAIPLN